MLRKSKRWEACVRRNVWVFSIVCVLVSGSALASGIEVTPTVGYRWDGDFDHLSLGGTNGELSLEDSEEYGLILSFPVTKRVDFEFRWSQQTTDLASGFGHASAPQELTSSSYLGGILVDFPVKSEVVRPFMNFEIGATQFDPGHSFTGQSGFSFGFHQTSEFIRVLSRNFRYDYQSASIKQCPVHFPNGKIKTIRVE